MERSEIRGRGLPAFRCAACGLRRCLVAPNCDLQDALHDPLRM